MAVKKTINFLPTIFRSDTNTKFLSATMDQLIEEPNLVKLYGYIGRKFAPTFKTGDSYVTESTGPRQNYQLEPSVVVTNKSNEITFFSSYPDLLNKIKYYGGKINNHSRLFDSEYYSFDPQISYDKLVNFSQYYWLPNGPDAVQVNTSGVDLTETYIVTRDSATNQYIFTAGGKRDYSVTLARGGTYKFIVNQPGFPFWIQSELGTDGVVSATPTISSRDVEGVENNGIDSGTITFRVPQANAQERFTTMPNVYNVDYAAPLPYADLQNKFISQFLAKYPGYAGITGSLDGKYLIFIIPPGTENWGEEAFINPTVLDPVSNAAIPGYDAGYVVPEANRYGVWQVRLINVPGVSEKLVRLVPIQNVQIDEKVYVKSGLVNANKQFYKDYDGFFYQIPLLTSLQDTLWVQDSVSAGMYQSLKIVNYTSWEIDVENDILGKQNYTSPNGVEFTSGLKIEFAEDVTPASYKNKQYYVENVGDTIRLVWVDLLVTPEEYRAEVELNYPEGIGDNTANAEYITINRASKDLNPWSRNNRWFHRDVILATAEYNNTVPVFNQAQRARRPIIQFESDLLLINEGRIGKQAIDILDVNTIDPFTELQGKTFSQAFGITLTNGLRVLFAGAADPLVKNKVYIVNLVQYGYDSILQQPTGDYHINLVVAEDGVSEAYDTVVVKQGQFKGSQWWYDGINWNKSQQKTQLQQAPLFDVADITGKSFTEYERTSFAGTKLFGYLESSAGVVDPVLQIQLSYRNLSTQGELEFNTFFNTDTFDYLDVLSPVTLPVSSGFLRKIVNRDTLAPRNTWKTVVENTKQYQLVGYVANGVASLFRLDVIPNASQSIPYLKVYKNFVYQTTDQWMLIDNSVRLVKTQEFTGDGLTKSYTLADSPINGVIVSLDGVLQAPSEFGIAGNVITFVTAPPSGAIVNFRTIQVPAENDKIDILVYSDTVSDFGLFQVPTNLELNAQNIDIETVTLGQMRNHLLAQAQNSTTVIGNVLAISNLRDIEIKQQGGSILQNSAPVPYASLFLLDDNANLIDSVRYASLEYNKFKNKFLGLATTLEGIDPNDPVSSVDLILTNINAIKNQTFPWYYSDMVPYGTLKNTINRTVFNPLDSDYEITNVFNDQELSNQAVLVYLNGQQLIKNTDYIFLQDRPAVRFIGETLAGLQVDDIISIVEYTNTDGNYIPETPTKLGLWPKFVPELFLDETYRDPINVIRGHDGSITPAFGDYRDDFLLELEKRIYNNITRPDVDILEEIYTILPGKFRNNDYSIAEMNQIISRSFLNWVGSTKLDFSTNSTFKSNDPFTWNYSAFVDRIDEEFLPGSWRACYQYFYDTIRPQLTPWEMLGFSEKPSWWEDEYGPAPYTGGNKYLWDDLEAGRIRQGSRQGIDRSFARPGLSNIIPVDENGNLKPPTQILTKGYKSNQANRSWAVGEQGPVEFAWRLSSDFPFAVQQALAVAKPGRYFGLFADAYNYTYNSDIGQFLTRSTNRHLTQFDVNFNGNTVNNEIYRSSGYINWIADYLTSQGINPSVKIIDMVKNYQVKLAYKTAGYTDQKYLQVLSEQVSPNSFSDSIAIPNENYKVHLYKSTPINTLRYSAVIVEKTTSGYSVRGYDLNSPFFVIIPSQANNNAYSITVLNSRATIYKDYQPVTISVPYGHEFATQQQVVDFLVSYERYLTGLGLQFQTIDDNLGQVKNFVLSAKEFLYWAQQGWQAGNILVLSPIINTLEIISQNAITDGIDDSQFGSKVLDVNFKLVKNNNYDVFRTANQFKLTLLEEATVIGYAEVDLVQYEHVLVFDNNTVFNDVIYEPVSGSRQYRLKLIGQKTAAWDGSLYAPGFIYNSGVVDPWDQGKDYLKGDLVEYKNQYYTALENISAATDFQFDRWQILENNEIKRGLLPNFSMLASEAADYYNSYGVLKDKGQVQQSHSLIGYRPRQYLSDLGLTDTTQIEFYKGYIRQKGSANAVNQMLKAVFNNLNSDISFYEEWAMRVGEYGALHSNPYVEIPLDENAFSVNPAIAQFVQGASYNDGDGISIFNSSQLYKLEFEGEFDGNIALTRTSTSNYDNDIPTAGFVSPDDVDMTIFDLNDYQQLVADGGLDKLGSGFTIWCAKDFQRRWNVFRVTETENEVLRVENSLDNYITFTTRYPHRLSKDELFVVKSFDAAFDGFYQVYKIISNKEIMVRYTGDLGDLTTLEGSGLLFILDSLRFLYMEDARQYFPPHGWQVGEKIWIEDDAATSLVQGQPVATPNNTWKVYEKNRPWKVTQELERTVNNTFSNANGFGTSIKMSEDNQIIVSGAPYQGNTGVVNTFLRDSKGNFNENFLLEPNAGNANVKTQSFGYVVDLSQNKTTHTTYLAVGAPLSDVNTRANVGFVYVYKKGPSVSGFSPAQVLVGNVSLSEDQFGSSLAFNQTGDWLYVGGVGNNGKVSLYGLKRFVKEASGVVSMTSGANVLTVPFTRDPNVSSTDANSLLITTYDRTYIPVVDYTVSGQTVTFRSAFTANIDVSVSQGPYYTMLNNGVPLTHPLGNTNTRYGYALSSSFDGAQLAVGTPDDLVGVHTTAANLQPGKTYIINSPGTSNFVSVGAANNLVGTSFVATGATTGNGIAIAQNIGAGSVWVYDRIIEAFKADGSSDYETQSNIADVYRVTIEDVEVYDYRIVANSGGYTNTVRFLTPPPIGKVIFVETNQFNLLEQITGDDQYIQANAALGTSLTICSNNCAIYVGAPYYDAGTSYNTGAVYKFHNRGRLYGTNTGTVKNPTFTPGESIRLDNFEVVVTGTTLDSFVADINNAGILGVSAVNEDGYLRLNSDKTVAKNLLRMLSGTGNVYVDAGLEVFAQMQLITNPFHTPGEYFGTKVKLAANAYMLVIGSGRGTTKTFTTFDAHEDKLFPNSTAYVTVDGVIYVNTESWSSKSIVKARLLDKSSNLTAAPTTYDNQSTVFFDDVHGSGSVYIYELYDDPRDDVEHPGRYQYCQQLDTDKLDPGDQFGYALDIEGTYIIISAPGDDDAGENAGSVFVFNNPKMTRGWNLIHYQENQVDIDSVSRMYLYDSMSNTIVNNLQFIDPAKGKILGQAEQEITYKTEYDPALYNRASSVQAGMNQKVYWGEAQVGQVWWDLSTIRFIDYEQGSLTFRSINWGNIFPGSSVDIYEWVESSVLPSQYVENGGNGVPKHPDNSAYVENIFVDATSNIISTKYYFWVKGKTVVDKNNARRRIPISSVQDLIQNPKSQGIAYGAVIRNDAVILYNVSPYLSADNTVLHIDFQKSINTNIIHSEYELIQENNPKAILPVKIVNKMIDSLSGIDSAGNSVPDPQLSAAERYGISIRPRQSMFVDRLSAMAQLISFVNQVFVENPIADNFDLSALNDQEPLPSKKLGEYHESVPTNIELGYIDAETLDVGHVVLVESDATQNGLWVLYELTSNKTWNIRRIQSYKNSLYWNYIDWYASGYSTTTKPTYSVNSYVDALKLPYAVGDIIKVTNMGNGEWRLFLVGADRSFTSVGIQNGTIQLSDSLSNFGQREIGYGNQGFDTNRYDQSPNTEIRSIVTAIKDTIFINNLSGKSSDLFFTLINYLLTEQNYVDWLFKSSFVSVTHKLRTLSQFPSYVRDNQTYYQNYINEVKPYRSKVREYTIDYTGSDEFLGSITDFDLPAYYDTTLELFRSPSGEEIEKDEALWQTETYNQWYNNRALSLDSITISQSGANYATPPLVTITGGGGKGATAIATIDGNTGAVIGITVTNSGGGYTTTPTVIINGSASTPAEAVALMKNYYVRSFETHMKFDRVTYHSEVKEWAANTTYRAGDVIAYSRSDGDQLIRNAYSVKANITTGSTFVPTDYNLLTANVFATANDRIVGFYQPRIDMPVIETVTREITVAQTVNNSNVMYVTSLPGLRRNMTVSSSFANAASVIEVVSGVLLLSGNITANVGDQISQTHVSNTYINTGNVITSKWANVSLYANVEILANLSSLYGNITNAYRVGSYLTDYEFTLGNTVNIVNLTSNPGNMTVTSTSVYPVAVNVTAIQLDREQNQAQGNVLTATYHGLGQLVSSIDYPGVQVQGAEFAQNPGFGAPYGSVFDNIDYDSDGTPLLSESSLDTVIRSSYTDTLLGTRAEDIIVDGSGFVSTYSSHAPEELIPGRVFDSIDMQIYTKINGNTEVLGYRVFNNMLGDMVYSRVADAYSTTLTQALLPTDTVIHVADASVLSVPFPASNMPGVIFIGPERITYYELNADSNTLGKIRRGTHGTAILPIHGIGARVIDSGANQYITGANVRYANVLSSNITVTVNTANVGNTYTRTFAAGTILETSYANVWLNWTANVGADGTGLEGSTTTAALFLKAATAGNVQVATVSEMITTEDAVNTITTENGEILVEEDQA